VVKKNKAIFFDRDGTLIKTFVSKKNIPIAIKNIKDLRFENYANLVINKLRHKYYIFIITNQPDVSRGKNTKKNVVLINSVIKTKLKIDKIFTSYSDNEKNFMRKPNPGMIYKAKKIYDLNLKKSYVVGDRCKDILAGKKSMCKTILINKKYNSKINIIPDFKINNLKDLLLIIKV